MQEIDVYSSLVGDFKKNSSGELIVVLFELCNLTCQACFQDHNSVIGIDQVREKFELINANEVKDRIVTHKLLY